MKKQLFNKRGMTYVELLVALALLALIVVSFTPMLMTSYETLYEAGVKTETVYNSQQELEEGLAVRGSTRSNDIAMTFKMNAQKVFENLNVNGRKVVSSLQDRLETIFHGVRARIDILSSDVVYDDSSSHEVILQTTGLNFTKVTYGTYSGDMENMPEDQIHIQVYVPEKSYNATNGSTDDVLVYKNNLANFTLNSKDADKGRISFTVSGVDFTQSPLKIIVYYKNERGHLKSLSEYLYIKPATMLMAGTTKSNDYYTSAGVEQVDASTDSNTQVTEYRLIVEGRTMRLDNSGLFSSADSPKSKGVIIKTVAWVDNDENQYIDPYYVMAGTNGSVYRMYNMNTMSSLKDVMKANNDVTGTTDYSYKIDTGATIYPSFWSGEMSDQYSFQTMFKSSTYGNAKDNDVDCSAPNSDYNVIGTQYNKLDKTLRYAMMFNSFRTGYTYASQMSRRISYVLTEAGTKSFRIAGKKYEENDFIGYHIPWEADYLKFSGGVFSANTSDDRAIYLGGKGALAAKNVHTDMHMAYLRLNTYTNINPLTAVNDNTDYGVGETIADRFVTGGEFWSPPGYSEESLRDIEWKNRENYLNTPYANNANITSAVYLPGSGSKGQGQVIYFGTVPAYALVRQCSDIVEKQTKVYNTGNVVESAATMYLICGTQGNGTTIYKNSYSGSNGGNKAEGVDAQNLMRSHIQNGSASIQTSAEVFYTTKGDSITYKHEDANLEFTLGYCSRWRMAIGDVTFNGSKEETKSYEHYYTRSHPSAGYIRKPAINGGGVNNLYYNVWFPGEFYNLTEAASCDEVTVAVGYTVSGSTFMSESWVVRDGYYGTALGSVYNDGVVAAYTSTGNSYTVSGKGDKTTIFQNLLYYKSETFINSTLHSRKNIRFVAVGVNSETTKTSNNAATKKYYAYYGDNYGNVYRSLVATASVGYNTDTGTSSETTNLVSYIADPVSTAGAPSTMEAIMVNGNPMSSFFAEIISIDAKEDIIIVTGTPKGTAYNIVVVGTKDDSNNWSWKTVKLGGYSGEIITSSYVVGGYYYVGVSDGTNNWLGAANIETLRAADNGHTLPPADTKSTSKDAFIYTEVSDTIYAIAGHETN